MMNQATTKTQITVETIVDAPMEKVWEVWTEPEHITKWCAASDDWHAPSAENDLREGGHFTTKMAAKDGSMSFDFGGVYSKVIRHELVEYEMGDGRKVSIRFSSDAGKTKVTETFDAETTHPEEVQRQGWQAILENFRKHAESQA